jgi:hypothetical protein
MSKLQILNFKFCLESGIQFRRKITQLNDKKGTPQYKS